MISETRSRFTPEYFPGGRLVAPEFRAREFVRAARAVVNRVEQERAAGKPIDILEYLRERHPGPVPASRRPGEFPERFHREPDIFLAPMRFGRTRLLLSRFIGRAAWRIGGAL